MKPLVPNGNGYRRKPGPAIFGVDLRDAREEIFVRMVCDGLAIGIAYVRAGFKSKDNNAPYALFHLPRIQERANAILEARRTTGVVTLPEVTEMLQRVFTGAYHNEEYSAAHNAAFSLARLYGHVTDRATLEVIRRPSRDPDAPSEQALEAWALSLPVVGSGPGPSPADTGEPGVLAPPRGAPASLLGGLQGPGPDLPNDINNLQAMSPGPGLAASGPEPSMPVDVHRNQLDFSNEINGLAEFRTLTGIGTAGGRSENGAPSRAVTETPDACGPSGPLGPRGSEKGAPLQSGQVPVLKGGFPPIEDLF